MQGLLTDHYLLSAFVKGDASAFDALFRRYAPRVHATAYRMTGNWEEAEDVLQEVFIRLARQAASIRREKALSAWIYRTAINASIDALRKRRNSVSLDADEKSAGRIIQVESLRRESLREESRLKEELFAQIETYIPRLPERQAAAFVLRSFQGLTHAEVAAIMGCGESAAKSHYSLACTKLREWASADAASREKANPKTGEVKS